MSVTGWCMDANQYNIDKLHEACPVKTQRFYMGTKRAGRKTVDAVIYIDEWHECDCKCHKPVPEKPVRKTRKKR